MKYKHRDERENVQLDPPEKDKPGVSKSHHYHAYFEGYAEKKVWDAKKNRERIARVYVGDYYYRNLSKKSLVARNIVYFVLLAAAVLILYLGGAQALLVTFRYVYLPVFVALLVSVVLLGTLINYVTAPEKQTVGEYKASSRRLKRMSLIAALCMVVQTLSLLVYVLIYPEAGAGSAKTIAVIANAAACVPFLMLYYLEKNVKYIVKNENKPDMNPDVIL